MYVGVVCGSLGVWLCVCMVVPLFVHVMHACVCIYIHKHYCEHVCGVYMYVYCVCDGNMCIYMCMNERMCAFVYICACEWEYENKAIE